MKKEVFLFNSTLFIFTGLLFGVGLDYIIHYFQCVYSLKPIEIVIIQIISFVATVYILNFYISSDFVDLWQAAPSGIFFVSLFFNSQFNFFSNIQRLLGYTNRNQFMNYIETSCYQMHKK